MARERLLSRPGEPLFIADWERVLMIHYQMDASALQQMVPFELDLWDGAAFISLAAFNMRGMRLRRGGWLGRLLMKPIASHNFLNVRTYVRHNSESGIYFLAEWLANPLSVFLGPRLFGLPYRLGRLHYRHRWESGLLTGRVIDSQGRGELTYKASLAPDAGFRPCETGSLCEWLMERYTAFTCTGTKQGFFRVWHLPWMQASVPVEVNNRSLLEHHWPMFRGTQFVEANFSPELKDVWMGRPHRIAKSAC